MQYWFYHLENASIEATLAPLLEKCQSAGWRALVRSPNRERLAFLDDYLWSYRQNSWLPHARTGEGVDEARQPILLTQGMVNHNHAQALFLLDAAELGDTTGVERAFLVFDGNDEAMLKAARAEWKRGQGLDYEMAYWQQSDKGKWEKKV
ncbi:MAG: DNA polymerase III subunit chi [Pseudomonadota bacterium]|jgi:DNA polymerase-3 subunit chi